MKKILPLFAILAFTAVTLTAQIRKVPAEVTNAFKEKYPSAGDVEWKDKITSFEASFKEDGADMKATFTKKDGWKETEISIDFDKLPGTVKDGFTKSKYSTADWKRGSVTKIVKNGKDTRYKIYVEKNAVSKKFLWFSENGQLKNETIGV